MTQPMAQSTAQLMDDATCGATNGASYCATDGSGNPRIVQPMAQPMGGATYGATHVNLTMNRYLHLLHREITLSCARA